MNVLDLFSGIGGFSLGLESTDHFRTVAFCEIEPFCQKVLRKHWPDVPIYEDIKELTRERLVSDGIIEDPQRIGCSHGGDDKNKSEVRGQREPSTRDGNGFYIQPKTVDLICGGFPCQPFSHAGKRKGTDDNRYLWPEMLRVIREVRPTWVLGENVAGIVNMALEQVCLDLEGEGYEVQPFIIPAASLNAPHKRDRVWIIGHSKDERSGETWKHSGGSSEWITRSDCHAPHSQPTELEERLNIGGEGGAYPQSSRPGEGHASDTTSIGWRTRPCGNLDDNANQPPQCYRGEGEAVGREYCSRSAWEEPWLEAATRLCTLDDGLSRGLVQPKGWRVNALKAAGNAVVPQIVAILGEAIWENQINCS